MEPNRTIKKMKRELIAAILSVATAFIALSSATYAWYVANNSVKGTTSSIAATTNGFVLQIVSGLDPVKGGSSAMDDLSLSAETEGHFIGASSTADCKTWWIPEQWSEGLSKVKTYKIPEDLNLDTGYFTIADQPNYAYIVSTYTLYTILDTGLADVYLDSSADGGAIQVTRKNEDGTVTDKVASSLRVGIVINDRKEGSTDQLKLVYAPISESEDAVGNDENATAGWSCVASSSTTQKVPYPYVYGTTYIDQNGKNWAAVKNGDSYHIPTQNSSKIAEKVTADGVTMKIYIWMEGTDADCRNSIVNDDKSSYNVVVNLAGVTAE